MTINSAQTNWRRFPLILAVILTLLTPSRVLADDHGNHGNHGDHGHHDFQIIPPNQTFRGLSYGEWQARWWQWAFSVPVTDGTHPIFPGGDIRQGQSGRVWFLSAPPPVTDKPEVRRIRIREGTALFFPAVNAECSTLEPFPFHGDNEPELRACAKAFTDRTFEMHVRINGERIRNLERFRHQSPVFTIGPLPENNILGLPAGTKGDSVDDGVYVMVLLEEGQHTIRFGASLDTSDLDGFSDVSSFDVVYRITVVNDD